MNSLWLKWYELRHRLRKRWVVMNTLLNLSALPERRFLTERGAMRWCRKMNEMAVDRGYRVRFHVEERTK